MASLFATVFPDANQTALGDIEAVLTVATLSGTNQQTAVVADGGTTKIKRVRVFVDGNAWVSYGTNPDATDTAKRFPMGSENPEYFTVPVGAKFAAITR